MLREKVRGTVNHICEKRKNFFFDVNKIQYH